MIVTIFKLRRNGLKKAYSQIEIQEQDVELLIYSERFKLIQSKGRPRQILHESFLTDLIQLCPEFYNAKYKFLHLEELYSILSKNWIEDKEFKRVIWDNRHLFLSWRYGDV
jgi:hypothetical protein